MALWERASDRVAAPASSPPAVHVGPSSSPIPVGPCARRASGDSPLTEREIGYFARLGESRLNDLGERARLWRAWGMCQRHALGFVAVEAWLEDGWLFRPAVLYAEIMERAQHAVAHHWFMERARAEVNLGGVPCPACDLGLTAAAQSAPGDGAEPARDGLLEPLRALAARTRVYWGAWLCGTCSNSAAPARCRIHLAEDLEAGRRVDLAAHRATITMIARRVDVYAASFGWARRGTQTVSDEAGLIGAIGWCSGWRSIMRWLS
jgi:hypothetical protein